MKFAFRVLAHAADTNMQDLEGKIDFYWEKIEIEKLSSGIRAAIEVVILSEMHLFEKDVNYCFNDDSEGRYTLQLSTSASIGARRLSDALKRVWKDVLDRVDTDHDGARYNSSLCTDFGTKRVFLKRLELIDSLLRINFYVGQYWKDREHFVREDFMAELRS